MATGNSPQSDSTANPGGTSDPSIAPTESGAQRERNRSADTDRGSVVNQGSEGDEPLNVTEEAEAQPGDEDDNQEVDQSGTRGARGKPGPTVHVSTDRSTRG